MVCRQISDYHVTLVFIIYLTPSCFFPKFALLHAPLSDLVLVSAPLPGLIINPLFLVKIAAQCAVTLLIYTHTSNIFQRHYHQPFKKQSHISLYSLYIFKNHYSYYNILIFCQNDYFLAGLFREVDCMFLVLYITLTVT